MTFVHAANVCVWQVATRKTCIEIELFFGILVSVRRQTTTRVRSCVVEHIFMVALVHLEFFVRQNSDVHVLVRVVQIGVSLLPLELVLLEFEFGHSRVVVVGHCEPGMVEQSLGARSVRRIPLQHLH